METIGVFFSKLVEFMQHEYVIYGYPFSFWQIFIFMIVAGIVCGFISGIFDN